MKSIVKKSLAGVAIVAAACSAAPALANCGDVAGAKHILYTDDQGPGAFRIVDAGPSIVGMWRVQFLAGGSQIDFGYSQWHADGTEFMNSGSLNPAGQNYCLGVWQKTGPMSYHLNHYAFAYAPQTQNADGSPAIHLTPALNVNIKEDVTIDAKGNTFSGTFTIDFYDFKTNAQVNHIGGRILGQRVTAY